METWTWALGQGGTLGAHIAGCPADPWVQQGLPEPKVDPRGSSDCSRGLISPPPSFPCEATSDPDSPHVPSSP